MEAEVHFTPVRVSEPFTIPLHVQRQMHPTISPSITQFVWSHGYRREAAGGFGLEKTKTCFHFAWAEGTQADVVQLKH